MKVLITFMGLLSLNIMFLTYQSDMNQYIREQTRIKSIAQECAAGAALFFDETAFSQGYLKFNRKEAEKYVTHFLQESMEPPLIVDYDIEYFESPEVAKPAVAVNLTVKGRDWFRLGFLTVTEIERKAYFEHLSYDGTH